MNKQTTTAPAAAWCVRFRSGSLRGRTFALKPGTNVLGSANECDIMLNGDVQPRHLVFTVGDIAVSIRKFGTAAVRLNGEELSLQRRSTVAGDIISVADIDFELDRVEGADRASLSEPPGDAAEEAQQEPVSVEAERAPRRRKRDATPGRYRAGAVIAALVAGVAISAGVGLRAVEYPKGPSQSRHPVPLPTSELEAVLGDFPDINVTNNADGTASIKAYVTSSARKVALQRALEPFGDRVNADVHVTDDILQRARSFLNEPGVIVTYTGHGRLVVSGIVDSEPVRQKIKRLAKDLLPAVAVLDQVQYGQSETQGDMAALQNTLPSPMVGLTEYGNGLRQIQLANGQRYYEGATLKSGSELVNIEADRLVLSNSAGAKASEAQPTAEKSEE